MYTKSIFWLKEKIKMCKKNCAVCPPVVEKSIDIKNNCFYNNYSVLYPTANMSSCNVCIYYAIEIMKTVNSSDTPAVNKIRERLETYPCLKKELLRYYESYQLKQVNHNLDPLTEFEKCYIMLCFIDTNRHHFQREEERIICTEAFRRLQYKTQVMVNSVSDDQRTRLLHSLEVQKISRKIAFALNANSELAETIAIAHDIGHAPFGHAGENAFDKYLSNCFAGRFSHAVQGVKVIDFLCAHRALKPIGLKGLAVSDYVLEGILKHDSDSFTRNAASAAYRLQYDCHNCYKAVGYTGDSSYDSIMIGGIETQIVHWADKIAYLGHDWEEFVSVGLLETMLFRVNTMVIKMKEYTVLPTLDDTISSVNSEHSEEINNMHEILKIVNEIRNEYVKLSGDNRKITDFSKIELGISRICECINKVILPKNSSERIVNKLMSQEQYKLFYNFFSAVKSWVKITGTYPQNTGEKMDVIFIFYNYLNGITCHRITPTLVNKLISTTIDSLKDIPERDTFITICNDKWNTIRRAKSDRHPRKAMIVGFSDEDLEQIIFIQKFIKAEFIHSTRIRNMTYKAEVIINELLNFYSKNTHMLPLKQRNRIEYETTPENQQRIWHLLQMYYKERFSEPEVEENISQIEEQFKQMSRSLYAEDSNVSFLDSFSNYKESQHEVFSVNTILSFLNDCKHEQYKNVLINNVIQLRIIVDYISGMTDRMAEMKYNEIIQSTSQWSKAYSERAVFTP